MYDMRLWMASGMTAVAQRRKGTCRKCFSSRYRIFSLSNATWSAPSCSLKAPKAANREVANAFRLRSCAFAMKSSTVSPFTCWEIELKSWHVFTAKVEQQPHNIAFLARASRMKLMRSHWKSSAAFITEPRSVSRSLKIILGVGICKISFFGIIQKPAENKSNFQASQCIWKYDACFWKPHHKTIG